MSKENLSSEFPAISDINQGVRPMKMMKMALDLIFSVVMKKWECTIHVAKTKMMISCLVSAQLICSFDFAMSKSVFLNE